MRGLGLDVDSGLLYDISVDTLTKPAYVSGV